MQEQTVRTERNLTQLRERHLAETDWLAAHLEDLNLRVVDVRGDVRTQTEPDGYQTAEYLGRRNAYEPAHIPGAVYLDWTTDLVDENDPVPAQAAPPEKLAALLTKLGLGDGALIVAYDDHPANQFATRFWWLLRYYGHDSVRVLNGGWKKWTTEGHPVTAAPSTPSPMPFTPKVDPQWRKTAEEVRNLLGDAGSVPGVTLVDARDEGQFTGRVRRGVRGGHIPGAINVPREGLVGPDRTFADAETLRAALTSAGLPLDELRRELKREVIAYCNGGVASTTVLFALSLLGHSRLSNYDGSWNEWNQREELPVEAETRQAASTHGMGQ